MLFAYVVLAIWSQGLGERRIRDSIAHQEQRSDVPVSDASDEGSSDDVANA